MRDLAEVDPVLLRDLADLLRRADEDRRDQALAAGLEAPASAVSSHGCATAVGTGSRLRHRASSCSYFPVPVSRVMLPRVLPPGLALARSRRRSGLLEKESENDRQRDAVEQRLERRLVVLERHLRRRRR